jgi:hypothetical protein
VCCLFYHEHEKETAREAGTVYQGGISSAHIVLDLHLPRTGKKVKFILGHNCVRLESWASLPVHSHFPVHIHVLDL